MRGNSELKTTKKNLVEQQRVEGDPKFFLAVLTTFTLFLPFIFLRQSTQFSILEVNDKFKTKSHTRSLQLSEKILGSLAQNGQ